jgi:hypothetical protein
MAREASEATPAQKLVCFSTGTESTVPDEAYGLHLAIPWGDNTGNWEVSMSRITDHHFWVSCIWEIAGCDEVSEET